MRILVRAPNWVGDAIMAIPTLQEIRRSHPEARVSILAKRAVADTYRDQPFADEIVDYDDHGRHRGFFGRESLARELRLKQFDVAILLQNAFEAAWLAWRAGIPKRIGYARNGRTLLLTQAVALPDKKTFPRHESQYYLELLRGAGWIESRDAAPVAELIVTGSAHAKAVELLLSSGSARGAWRCAMAPGANYGAAKCWLPERFAAVADRLISECNADVILFGTSSETEIAAKIMGVMKGRAISLVGKTSMSDLGALFSACSAFIGNDSGAMHVAAAVGLPVIGIFGPTDPAGTSPLTEKFTLIREPVFCSPCFLRRCPIDHRCMTRIEVNSVFAAAQRLQSSARQPHSNSISGAV